MASSLAAMRDLYTQTSAYLLGVSILACFGVILVCFHSHMLLALLYIYSQKHDDGMKI
jgi:hypothetical protein